jgi:Flp pilus assembly protein TadG
MALTLPIFLLVVFGIIEFGRAMMVGELLANAARLGARRAILEDQTNSEVEQVVDDFCAGTLGVEAADVTVTISINGVAGGDLASTQRGDLCEVNVAIPFNVVSWLGSPRWLAGADLQGTCTMEHE